MFKKEITIHEFAEDKDIQQLVVILLLLFYYLA